MTSKTKLFSKEFSCINKLELEVHFENGLFMKWIKDALENYGADSVFWVILTLSAYIKGASEENVGSSNSSGLLPTRLLNY